MCDCPTTKEEWWECVDELQDELIGCVRRFHPNVHNSYHPNRELVITAADAEAACEKIREEIRQNSVGDPVLLAKMYIADRDSRLVSILNETWFGAPESSSVMSVPGFAVLCDLCSESYLLYEDEEDVDSA